MTDDLFSVAGKVALVTGGSSGIGRMIAGGLVERGATVYVSSRKADACQKTADELSDVGTCVALPADLSTEDGCRRLGAELAERESSLHVLVNNAGNTWGAPLAEFGDDAWDRVLALNVKGVFHTTTAVLPLLEAASTADDPSRIINIGSINGIEPPPLETYSYSASKAAVHQLTRHLSWRLAPAITVNAIAPGPFESKMMAATLAAAGDFIAAGAPMQRIGRPDDIIGTVLFLASRAGSYLTGTVIPVDGGMTVAGSRGPQHPN